MKKFMKIAAIAAAMIALCVSCEKEGGDIDGKQFVFELAQGEDMVPCCFDFGVTKPGKFVIGMDMYGEMTVELWKMMFEEMFEDEGELAAFAQRMYDATNGKYVISTETDYEIVPTDDASGIVKVSMVDPYSGETISTEIKYSGFDGKNCTFNNEDLTLNNVEAAVATETIAIVSDPLASM